MPVGTTKSEMEAGRGLRVDSGHCHQAQFVVPAVAVFARMQMIMAHATLACFLLEWAAFERE